jgi:hypothetical protein
VTSAGSGVAGRPWGTRIQVLPLGTVATPRGRGGGGITCVVEPSGPRVIGGPPAAGIQVGRPPLPASTPPPGPRSVIGPEVTSPLNCPSHPPPSGLFVVSPRTVQSTFGDSPDRNTLRPLAEVTPETSSVSPTHGSAMTFAPVAGKGTMTFRIESEPLTPFQTTNPPSGSSLSLAHTTSAKLKLALASVGPLPFVSRRRDSSDRTPCTLK